MTPGSEEDPARDENRKLRDRVSELEGDAIRLDAYLRKQMRYAEVAAENKIADLVRALGIAEAKHPPAIQELTRERDSYAEQANSALFALRHARHKIEQVEKDRDALRKECHDLKAQNLVTSKPQAFIPGRRDPASRHIFFLTPERIFARSRETTFPIITEGIETKEAIRIIMEDAI